MQFHLIFEGDLRPKPQANLSHIHSIRMALHEQLAALWSISPLSETPKWQEPKQQGWPSVLEIVGDQQFVPLVSENMFTLAELQITILRDRHAGSPAGIHGDIDNRVKTLSDALRIPSTSEFNTLVAAGIEWPEKTYCLLQDDRLVTKLTVETDRWLAKGPHVTMAIIRVAIKTNRATMHNLVLAT